MPLHPENYSVTLMKEKELYQKAAELWGIEAQIRQAVEECAEMITVLCHKDRGKVHWEDVAKEIADVEIMCSQLREIIGSDIVDRCKKEQLARLEKEIEKISSARSDRADKTV